MRCIFISLYEPGKSLLHQCNIWHRPILPSHSAILTLKFQTLMAREAKRDIPFQYSMALRGQLIFSLGWTSCCWPFPGSSCCMSLVARLLIEWLSYVYSIHHHKWVMPFFRLRGKLLSYALRRQSANLVIISWFILHALVAAKGKRYCHSSYSR